MSSPLNATTYRKAINEIKSKIKNASDRNVHIYSFNVHPEQLEDAHALLNKVEGRRSMRVTYSDDHNFIVRYMPSRIHEQANGFWIVEICGALVQLTGLPQLRRPPGCTNIAGTTFQLGSRQKQADGAVGPHPDERPSIVLEVGDSESLTQLKIDAKLWIEHMPEVQLVILLSVDRTPPPNPPIIIVQLWRGFPPERPLRSPASQQRVAHPVWRADWTHAATPLYILLSDIFRGQVPAAYGANQQVNLDTVAWRQSIIDNC